MLSDRFLPLVSKQGVAVIKLANLLLAYQPGDRIQPIQDYAVQLGIGRGTVQAALSYLEEIGAVRLESRGHLGTFLREIDYPQLWSLTGQNQVAGGMPLPYSRRYEGLASGLHEAFRRAEIALNLVYTRGSLNRLRALAKGQFDFVVLSRFAFHHALELGLAIEEVLGLGPESYVGQHITLLKDHTKAGIENGMRIGIDPSSIDQVLLAREACRGKTVEFVEVHYMSLMAAMEKGQIDATVWNQDDFFASSYPFKAVPLALGAEPPRAQENTEAVLVVARGNQLMRQTLYSAIDPGLVCEIQKEVMAGRRVPAY